MGKLINIFFWYNRSLPLSKLLKKTLIAGRFEFILSTHIYWLRPGVRRDGTFHDYNESSIKMVPF